MIGEGDIFETVLRGASAGISLFIALALLFSERRTQTQILGALFSFAIGVYVLISGDATRLLIGNLLQPAIIIAIWGTVFFWWFGSALFDDEFSWRWWRLAPFILLPLFYVVRQSLPPSGAATALLYIHLTMNALLFADVFRLAVTHAADDLVLQRRRFRIAIAAVVGVYGLGIAVAEIIEVSVLLPDLLVTFHIVTILTLNILFGVWLLTVRPSLFALGSPPGAQEQAAGPQITSAPSAISRADQPVYERLMAIMDEGVYRQEGLNVQALAEKVGVPEHQLRKLINGALGFRNFSAFLNGRRISDAKLMLEDPANARKQVLQIALDLGYGSIAPFNRAFKAQTGMTPTQYRKQKLGRP